MTRWWRLAVVAAVAAAAVLALWPARGRRRPARESDHVRLVDGDALDVVAVTAQPLHVVIGQRVRLAVDVDHGRSAAGALAYQWHAKAGGFDGDGTAEAVWIAAARPGRHTLTVRVGDGDRSAEGRVTVEVRLPAPRAGADIAALLRERAAALDAGAARALAIDARLAELELVAGRGDTIADLQTAQEALEEMATLLEEAGRYEEALAVWDRRMVNMLPGSSRHAACSTRRADDAFMLGDDAAALAGWDAGGEYTDSMSRYYQGQILEGRGDPAGALAAYTRAADGLRWFGDPVYRRALLMLDAGADPAAVADLLVQASARLDRDRMLERFASDPETARLRRLLEQTGRIGALQPEQPLELELAGPGRSAPPGGG